MGGRIRRTPLLIGVIALAVGCGNDRERLSGDLACDTLTILQERCGSCHGDPPARGAPMSLTSLAVLRGGSPVFGGSSLAQRSLSRMRSTEMRMPPAPLPNVPPEEVAVIAKWVSAGMPACATDPGGPGEVHPNQIPQDELFACDGNPGSSPQRVRRLDRRELRFNIPSVSDVNNPGFASTNPFDANAADPFSTFSSDETIDDLVLDMYLEPGLIGGRVGQEMTTHLGALRSTTPSLNCIFTSATPTVTCVTDFVTVLLEKLVLFRRARPDEVARLQAHAATVLATETAIADRSRSIAQIANTAWTSTAALFRSELGAPDPEGRLRLTDDELAHALAYTLSDRAPGAPRQTFNGTGNLPYPTTAGLDGHLPAIAAAARDGTIQDPTTIEALVRQYAGGIDPTRADLAPDLVKQLSRETHGVYWTSDKIAGFFREWLGYGRFPTAFKDQPGKTSKFQPTGTTSIYSDLNTSYGQLQVAYYSVSRAGGGSFKESMMVDQLDDVIARTVVEDQRVLATLLTTTRFYIAAQWPIYGSTRATQRPYGLDGDVPDTRDGRWVTLPATERAGVLTHPAWLASHGGNFEDDPSIVHRGKWVRENLLCQYIPPLSQVQVQAMVGPSHPDITARERLDAATSDQTCQACHRLMNPLGYPFEIYNHAGFVRAVDHDGSAPNGSALLVDMPDPSLDGPVTDAIDLSHKLAASNHVKRCFVRQAFRYYAGRYETRADACSLTRMEQAYDVKGSFLDLLISFVTSDAFLYRAGEGN